MIGYRKGSSFLHSLDPRVKLFWLILLSLFLVFLRAPAIAISATLANLILLQLSGITPADFWKDMRGILIFALIPIPLQLLAVGSLQLGILNSLILINLLSSAFLFISTTKAGSLIGALSWFRVPPSLSFAIALSLSFIPILQDDLHKARVAQAARGGRLTKPSSVIPTIIPLFHGIFSRARTLSISLDARGFDPEKKMEVRLAMNARDYAFLFFAFAFLSALALTAF